jgi:hypothetical protein
MGIVRLTKTAKTSVFRPRYDLETSRIEGRNVKYFGRVFLMLNYTDITQNTYIQS